MVFSVARRERDVVPSRAARRIPGIAEDPWPPFDPHPDHEPPADHAVASPRDQRGPILNRELSWIEFNARVLHEARDTRNPLLERVKFLAIFASNLDEFFQVRVSGLRRQAQASAAHHAPDGMTPTEQLAQIRVRVRELSPTTQRSGRASARSSRAEGVEILDYDDVPEHHETLRRRFHDEIFPVLTPLAVDPGHPFPYI